MNYHIVLSLDAKSGYPLCPSMVPSYRSESGAPISLEGRTTVRRIAQFPYQFPLVNEQFVKHY